MGDTLPRQVTLGCIRKLISPELECEPASSDLLWLSAISVLFEFWPRLFQVALGQCLITAAEETRAVPTQTFPVRTIRTIQIACVHGTVHMVELHPG